MVELEGSAVRAVQAVLFALMLASGLAGCVAPQGSGDEGERAEPTLEGVDESAEPVRVAFEVITRAGGTVDVAGTAWLEAGSSTAVLLLHGSSGRSDRFGPAVVPGYSLAHVMLASGRSAVAIDLPGYGETPANGMLVGMEDYAFVIDQVAAALRSGEYAVEQGPARSHAIVVALGVSMGGLLVDLTQGTFASFDGIVPTVWSHGRYSQDAARCYSEAECPEDPRVWSYFFENTDPAILEAGRNATLEPMPFGVGNSLWWNCWSCWSYALRPLDDAASPTLRLDSVTRTIDVPVLSILAEEDFFFEKEDLAAQGDYYPNAEFQLILLPDTGHAWAWHLDRFDTHARILDWMDGHGF